MDGRQRQRGVYVTAKQKKKLLELMTKHPELISPKVTQGFNYRDSQKMWQNIGNECNSLPGAKKTWRQWRKTWQDLRSKYKKRHAETIGELPTSIVMLTQEEQEVLGLKNVSSTTNYQEDTEFVPMEQDNTDIFDNEESEPSRSEAESIPEEKVFPETLEEEIKKVNNKKHSSEHSKCVFNCDMLAAQEERKLQIKEEYLNFKKDYLRQKLEIMKDQTEALKSIAKELCK